MAYNPEVLDPKKIEQPPAAGASPGRLARGDEKLMVAVAEKMGPGQEARDSLPTLGLRDKVDIAPPEKLGSMWDEAYARKDFSVVNAKMAEAALDAYKRGGMQEVEKLEAKIDPNIKTKDSGVHFVKTADGLEIHNVKNAELTQPQQIILEDNPELATKQGYYKLPNSNWVKDLNKDIKDIEGTIHTINVEEKPAIKSNAEPKPGSKVTIKLTDKAQVFRADDGSTIIYRDDSSIQNGDILYSEDGRTFHEVAENTSVAARISEHEFTFIDPAVNPNKEFKVIRNGNTVTVDGKAYGRVEKPDSVETTTLPEIRDGSLFKLPDGRTLYHSWNKYPTHINARAESEAENEAIRQAKTEAELQAIMKNSKGIGPVFADEKMFIGQPGNMKEVKILNSVMFMNGQTHIATSEGKLFIPGIHDSDKRSKWITPEEQQIQKNNPQAEVGTPLIDVPNRKPGDFINPEGEKRTEQRDAQISEVDLARTWEEVWKADGYKGDYSTVTQKLEKAIRKEFQSNNVDGVRELESKINKIIPGTAGPLFERTKTGFEIQNVQQVSQDRQKQYSDYVLGIDTLTQKERDAIRAGDIYRHNLYGWLEKFGPAHKVDVTTTPQLKPESKKTVKLTDESKAFQAADGTTIVFRNERSGSLGDIFYSKDGKTFQEVLPTGWLNDFIDPTDPNKKFKPSATDGRLPSRGDNITMDGKTFERVKAPESIEANKLPDISEMRRAEGVFTLPDGRLIVLSTDMRGGAEKIFIGEPGNMKPATVTGQSMGSMSGDHTIHTSEGSLWIGPYFYRYPNEGDKPSTWKANDGSKVSLAKQKPENYRITEDKKGLKLLPKQ